MTLPIRIRYSTIDHYAESRTFRTLAGARAYAMRKLGTAFDVGAGYAVDAYGTGKITVSGVTLTELLGLVDDTADALHRIENPDEWEIDAMMAEAAGRDTREFPADGPVIRLAPERSMGLWAEPELDPSTGLVRIGGIDVIIDVVAPVSDDDIEF